MISYSRLAPIVAASSPSRSRSCSRCTWASRSPTSSAAAPGSSGSRWHRPCPPCPWADFELLGNISLRVQFHAPPKVVLCRDTGSVDPGSGPIFGSVSGSEIQILVIAYAKDTFCLYLRYILWFFRYRACICICIANPNFMYRAQPWLLLTLIHRLVFFVSSSSSSRRDRWYCLQSMSVCMAWKWWIVTVSLINLLV